MRDDATRLIAEGPICTVLVGVPSAYAAAGRAGGTPARAPESVRALVDTGATQSCIEVELARSMGLPARSVGSYRPLGSAPREVAVFAAEIRVGHPRARVHPSWALLGVELAGAEFKVLVGRDLLRWLLLTYDGPGGAFLLTAP